MSIQPNVITDNTRLELTSEKPVESTRKAFFILVTIFILSVSSLLLIYYCFPELEEDEIGFIKLPRNIDDAKNLGIVLSRYKDRYYFTVLSAFFLTYIFLQSFAIPGSIFLSILSGFLFPFYLAIFLVCACSAIGASLCYILSFQLGRKIVIRYFPQKAAAWAHHVNNHRENLLNYIIFLRVTPFLPNWFINVTSPVIGVPAFPFIFGTFIGVAPPSFLMIQAGTTLQQLTSSSDAVSFTSFLLLILFGILALVPIVFKKKLREKME